MSQQATSTGPGAPADGTVHRPDGALSRAGMHRRLTVNSISNVSSYLVSLAVSFALTPFIIRNLGDSLYGFWVLLLSFIGYASILEMGVQPAVVKLVGHYKARGDIPKLHELLSAALLFFLAAGGIAGLVLVAVLPPLVPRFVSDLAQVPHLRWLFAVLAADAVVMFMTYLFAGILYGWQMYYAKNLIDIGTWLANALLLVLFLRQGGILALAASKLATDLVALSAIVSVCRRVFPQLRLQRRAVHRGSFRELLGFGSRIFVSATTSRLATHAQPMIISAVLSSAATAFYYIPARLVDFGRQMTWGLTTGFMPLFSELHSLEERALLESIYLRYSRYVLLVILPILVLLLVFGPPFIVFWLGPERGPEYAERGRPVLHLLAAAALVENLQPLLWRFFIGVGHLDFLVKVSAASSGLVVLAGIVLVKPFGLAGIAASVLVGAAVSQVVFAQHTCRFLGLPLLAFLRRVHLRPLLAAGLGLGAAAALARALGTGSILSLAAGATSTCLAYGAVVWLLALWPEERRWVVVRIRGRRRGNRP